MENGDIKLNKENLLTQETGTGIKTGKYSTHRVVSTTGVIGVVLEEEAV